MAKLNLSKFKITNKGLYWGLIICFSLLYLFVGFVSTLHSITFFNLANTMGLAILLGITYEVGQASVLFSILMSEKNKNKFLPWALMFLLTALQVTANVYASFKFMATSGNNDWMYWQKSILIGVQAANAEMYQVIISWIAGALLPIVALGMTALVAQNMHFMSEENNTELEKVGSVPDEEVDKVIEDEVTKRVASLIDAAKIADTEKSSDTQLIEKSDQDEFGSVDLTFKEPDKLNQTYIGDSSKYLDEEATYLTSTDEKQQLPSKKLGRPPKQKETVAVPKKEKGRLQKEEKVDVPQRKQKNKIIDPLDTESTTQVVTDLEQVIKPSKGDEVIKLITSLDKLKAKESITQPDISDEISQEESLTSSESRTPYIENGVEVIDAKAIPIKPQVKKN